MQGDSEHQVARTSPWHSPVPQSPCVVGGSPFSPTSGLSDGSGVITCLTEVIGPDPDKDHRLLGSVQRPDGCP